MFLLTIMLIGLLRLRRNAGGSFASGFARLLWKQVKRWRRFPIVMLLIDIVEGVVWFVIATVAEIPQAVRSGQGSYILFFAHPCFTPQVLLILDLNGSSFLFILISQRIIDRVLPGTNNVRPPQSGTPFFVLQVLEVELNLLVSMPL